MSEHDPAPAPFGSWFGPIEWWRFAGFAAVAVAVHLVLPVWVDAAERRPVLLLGLLVGGAALGLLMGRQDAIRARSPERGWRRPWVGMALVGLAAVAFGVWETLSENFLLDFPLALAAIGAAGVTGARMRDRALADAVPRT